MTKFPNIIAAVKAWEQKKRDVADAIARDLGTPPQSFAACVRRVEEVYGKDMGTFEDYGPTRTSEKNAAMMWRAAAGFTLESRRKYGVRLCSEAGDQATLDNAAHYAESKGKPLDMKALKLVKRAMMLHAKGKL